MDSPKLSWKKTPNLGNWIGYAALAAIALMVWQQSPERAEPVALVDNFFAAYAPEAAGAAANEPDEQNIPEQNIPMSQLVTIVP